MLIMRRLPPFVFLEVCIAVFNVLVCLEVGSLKLHWQPHRICVLVSGLLHFPHIMGPLVLRLLLHLCTSIPMLIHRSPLYFCMGIESVYV